MTAFNKNGSYSSKKYRQYFYSRHKKSSTDVTSTAYLKFFDVVIIFFVSIR